MAQEVEIISKDPIFGIGFKSGSIEPDSAGAKQILEYSNIISKLEGKIEYNFIISYYTFNPKDTGIYLLRCKRIYDMLSAEIDINKYQIFIDIRLYYLGVPTSEKDEESYAIVYFRKKC